MSGTTLDTSRSRNDGAVYLQIVTAPERLVSVAAGARLEANQRFGTYATHRTGMAVRIAQGMRAIASVGTGFKEPSFYENFATGFVHGNPDLEPEHSLNWEAGLEYTGLRRTMTARVTYFHQRFRDLMQSSGAPATRTGSASPPAVARWSGAGAWTGAAGPVGVSPAQGHRDRVRARAVRPAGGRVA